MERQLKLSTEKPKLQPFQFPPRQIDPNHCRHPRAIVGLDAHYCPDCRMSILEGTQEYLDVLGRSRTGANPNFPSQNQPEFDELNFE